MEQQNRPQEAIQRANPFINLPTRIFLTPEGSRLFAARREKLERCKNRKGVLRDGLLSKQYNALLVQKMILNSFVEEIYTSEPNMLQYRQELISTNNLIVYGILYKKLSPSLADMLFQSPVVKAYNRKNPKNSIVNLDMISREKVDQLRTEQAELFANMEQEIYDEVLRRVQNHKLISDEDKQVRIRSLDKFIAWIDRRIWYLYLIIYQTPLKKQIVDSFASNIAVYLERTQIATHLSNLLMEFVQNAEKAHFERIIVRNKFADKEMADRFLRDKGNRELVVQAASRIGQAIDVAWSMNPQQASIGQQYRIEVMVSNYGLISEEQGLDLSKKMRSDVNGISLARFYEDSTEDRLGAGLGLMYNSYLEDICRNEGIRYSCNIYPEPKVERTTVRMEIIF